MTLLTIRTAEVPGSMYNNYLKLIADKFIALFLLMLLSPILSVIALLIFIFGGSGSPIFRQRRVGKNGHRFEVFKFRTMHANADAILKDLLSRDPKALKEWTATQKLRNDPRIYQFGRFLRAKSLDELPQLWNIIRGDMSLVGPRPVSEDEMRRWYEPPGLCLAECGKHSCTGAAHAYRTVRPGLTGLWQVSGRSDTTYNKRLMLDCLYVSNLSFWQDILILCRTVGVVIRGSGAY